MTVKIDIVVIPSYNGISTSKNVNIYLEVIPLPWRRMQHCPPNVNFNTKVTLKVETKRNPFWSSDSQNLLSSNQNFKLYWTCFYNSSSTHSILRIQLWNYLERFLKFKIHMNTLLLDWYPLGKPEKISNLNPTTTSKFSSKYFL